MKNFFLIAFSVLTASLFAQENRIGFTPTKPSPPKFRKHLSLASAFSYSVINNRKEIRGQYKPGINVNIGFWTKPWFYWSAEYSWFPPHKSSPGFENINSWNTELNGNLLMGTATSKLKFRFLFGMNYLNWSGTYVGPDVVDDKTWYVGKLIEQQWIGANLGIGVSYPIAHRLNCYGDFRMRFASEERDLLSISDTAFNLGLQWKFLQNSSHVDKDDKQQKKTNSGRPSRTYKWLKKRGSERK